MASNKLNVALFEVAVQDGCKADNLKMVEDLLSKMPEGIDLVILPELFSTGFIGSGHEDAINLAEKNSGETMRLLQQLASRHNCAIIGSFMAHTADRLYNRGFFIEPSGEDYFYDKYHLFAIGGEDKIISKGIDKPKIVRFRGWNILLTICYDLRFPVWCRNSSNKYDLLVNIANWPKSRNYSWDHLTIARAIENECYLCGVNRAGVDSEGIEYGGDTRIVDFRGQVIASCNENSHVIYSTLNKALLDGYRSSFPVWRDADEFTINF